MTIKEIEERTGMDRANIRFYEKEGLLSPERLANGYRDYTEHDADILMRIKLLRSLHVPLDDIRALQHDEKTLEEVMRLHLHTLESEKQAVSAAEDVCRTMQNDHVSYETLDAGKYLTQLQQPKKEQPAYFSLPKEDTAPYPAHPWRRLFARTLDYDLYLLPLELFCLLTLRINPNNAEGQIATAFCAILAYLMMLFIEPALLHFFGTTPGKWLFGLHITTDSSTYLTYEEGLQRTWGVLRFGYGFGIPFYEIYRHWQCYKLCTAGEPCPWDEFPIRRFYTIRDTKPWRSIAWFSVTTAVVFVNVWAEGASALPPNRGDLTVAQFAQNYNYLVDYYSDRDWIWKMLPNGRWSHTPEPSELTFYYGAGQKPPQPEYTTDENGNLIGIKIEFSGSLTELSDSDHLWLTALAFTAAQPEARPLSDTASRIATRLPGATHLGDVEFTVYQVTISWKQHLIEDTFTCCFTVTKDPQP